MDRIRILLVDDNADFVGGVSALLAAVDHVEVVGVARSGRQAIEEVQRLRPDLVLTDGTMPEMDGFEATRQIKSKTGAPLVILMTFYDGAAVRREAAAAGADGFIAKSDVTRRLPTMIRELVNDRSASTRRPGSGSSSETSKKRVPPGDHLH